MARSTTFPVWSLPLLLAGCWETRPDSPERIVAEVGLLEGQWRSNRDLTIDLSHRLDDHASFHRKGDTWILDQHESHELDGRVLRRNVSSTEVVVDGSLLRASDGTETTFRVDGDVLEMPAIVSKGSGTWAYASPLGSVHIRCKVDDGPGPWAASFTSIPPRSQAANGWRCRMKEQSAHRTYEFEEETPNGFRWEFKIIEQATGRLGFVGRDSDGPKPRLYQRVTVTP